jgi:hypothetical protein
MEVFDFVDLQDFPYASADAALAATAPSYHTRVFQGVAAIGVISEVGRSISAPA